MINRAAFQYQCVRDLAWVMVSPSLLAQSQTAYDGEKVADAWCAQVYQQNLDWLQQLDADPSPLQQWLAENQSPLLGLYFESLLSFWLKQLPETELLAQNLVVGRPGLQIGEFDLLFRDLSQNQVVHWEAAVKFYLRYGQSDYQWLGPNPRDILQRKLNKVFGRQLHLSENVAAQQLLQARLGTAQIRPQAFIKGYLFYPYDSDWQTPSQIPAGVATTHLKGWWCRHAEMGLLMQQHSPGHRWRVMPRLEWLAPVSVKSEQALLDAAALLDYLADWFSGHYKALLLVELKAGDDGWGEVSRGFVVNESWPQ